MSLIPTKSQAAAAVIVGKIEHIAGHYAAAACHLNAITAALVALGNDDLAEFGNSLGPAEMESTLTIHATHGAALNAMLAQASGVLTAAGMPAITGAVDTSPLSEKLARQGRQIVFDGAAFSVAALPVPEPPPAIEPTDT
jgi:hypothetical protein